MVLVVLRDEEVLISKNDVDYRRGGEKILDRQSVGQATLYISSRNSETRISTYVSKIMC